MTQQTRRDDRRPNEARLARRIEAGVVAGAVLAGRMTPADPVPEADLRALVADGCAARAELVAAHGGLVWLVVNPVANRTGLDRDELRQEACLGMLEAIERFDPARGCFATFALVRMRLRVGEAAATRLGALGLPAKRARAWWQVQTSRAALEASGRTPGVEDIARQSGLDAARVGALLGWRTTRPLTDEDEIALGEPAEERGPLVEELLQALDRDQRVLIAHRYGIGRKAAGSCAEVAQLLGVSEATVRRRERAALAVLRRAA
ncbi:sigma-70 family RNA polymerase sigma factor [Propioniciclava soli]|uniref:sigma-70 family RNA polymerase sigma factor n=1 Tax=Propioniciclava soli TaxID=2775081 RepID=UPI001E33C87B|nr:sigma-70 family RNA polymerase sigma factor [Propioniciclava soli]